MQDHLAQILSALLERDVRFIVCGGVAAVLHGVERMTADLDLAVDREADNLRAFLAVMAEQRLEPRVPIPAESLLDPALVERMVREKNALVFTFLDPENPYRQVDVFLTEELSYENLLSGSEVRPLYTEERRDRAQAAELRVLGKSALIRMKTQIDPPRDKDVWDIRELRRLGADEEA